MNLSIDCIDSTLCAVVGPLASGRLAALARYYPDICDCHVAISTERPFSSAVISHCIRVVLTSPPRTIVATRHTSMEPVQALDEALSVVREALRTTIVGFDMAADAE